MDDQPDIPRQCRRAVIAAGITLGLTFLLGLSGVASITLLYKDPMFEQTTRGLEGAVVQTVLKLEWAIRLIHTYGGYVLFVLAGWTALEMRALARLLRAGPLRPMAARVSALGVIGSVLLAIGVAMLTVTGVSAAGFLKKPGGAADQPPSPVHLVAPTSEQRSVEWHTREFTYLVGLAALLVAAAAAQARKAATAAREATA